MTLFDYFVSVVGVSSDMPLEFCFCAFAFLYFIIDFVHTFFTAVSSWFKK